MSKTPLAVGERVRVYGWFEDKDTVGTGVVVKSGKSLWVDLENGGWVYPVHPKQCRRLKPKNPRRSVWIYINKAGDLGGVLPTPREDYVEFREVRRKK